MVSESFLSVALVARAAAFCRSFDPPLAFALFSRARVVCGKSDKYLQDVHVKYQESCPEELGEEAIDAYPDPVNKILIMHSPEVISRARGGMEGVTRGGLDGTFSSALPDMIEVGKIERREEKRREKKTPSHSFPSCRR